MNIKNKLFDYLKVKISNFQIIQQQGRYTFTCPNIGKHRFVSKTPTAIQVDNTDKISCLICSWKGEIFDCVRLLELDKHNWTDAQITDYLINTLALDMYKELDVYFKYGWALIPIAKNSKIPIQENWRESEFKDKISWIKWLNNDINIGVNLNKSGCIVIDVDNKEVAVEKKETRDNFIVLLNNAQTLVQNTCSGGKHYFFLNDSEIVQNTNIGSLKIDTRTASGQCLIAPSHIKGVYYNWENLGIEIKPMPKEIKDKLLELIKVDSGRNKEEYNKSLSNLDSDFERNEALQTLELKNNNLDGCCNDTFIKLGGIFINKFSVEHTEYILNIMKNL